VAVMLPLARIFRLGFLADFLSRSVLIGFLTCVGVQVAAGELSGLIGLPKEGYGPLMQFVSIVERVGNASYATTALPVAVLAVILGCKRFVPRAPGALIAVVGSIAASAVFDFARRGIAVVGPVPGGLPSLSLPLPPLRISELDQVLVLHSAHRSTL